MTTKKKPAKIEGGYQGTGNGAPSTPPKGGSAAKPARKPKLLNVPADYEETALAKANAFHRVSPAPAILQSVSDHIANRAAAGETSILALTPQQLDIADQQSRLQVAIVKGVGLEEALSFKTDEILGLQGRLDDPITAGETFDRPLDEAAAMNTDLQGDVTGMRVAVYDADAKMTKLEVEVSDLAGLLQDARREHVRDVAALRTDLDAADIAQAEAEALTQKAIADLGTARVRIKDLEWRASARQSDLSELKHKCNSLEIRLITKDQRISELGSELDAAEDCIGHLEVSLAQAQRGWIAKLFRQPASGRA